MSNSIAERFARLQRDPWRDGIGFSPDMLKAHEVLFEPNVDEGQRIEALSHWLQKYQPCLFGRIAARAGRITYCILDEGDLQCSDETIGSKIQSYRTQWTREGYDGPLRRS